MGELSSVELLFRAYERVLLPCSEIRQDESWRPCVFKVSDYCQQAPKHDLNLIVHTRSKDQGA